MPDKIDLLFDDLQSRGYAKDKTRKQFRDYMLAPGKQGYENRKTFLQDFQSNGETNLKNYEEFKGLLGLHAVKKPTGQTPSVYQKAKQQSQKAPAATQSQPAVNQTAQQPMQMPQGFGELDMKTANMSPWQREQYERANSKINPQTGKAESKQPTKIEKDLQDLDKAMKGDKEAAKRSGMTAAGQRMKDEIDYMQATGERLQNKVNVPFTAPTVARDENGEMILGEDGQPLVGTTTDEQRVAQYQQQERERARKEIIDPLVDDVINKTKENARSQFSLDDITDPGMAQYKLRMENEATSPESLRKALDNFFGFGEEEKTKEGGSRVLANWDREHEPSAFEQYLVDHQADIERGAARVGMSVDDFVMDELIPKMSEDIEKRFGQNMSEEYSIKGRADYFLNRMLSSGAGALVRMSSGITPQQSQLMQQELQKTKEGEGAHFNARWYDKAIGEVAQFAPDAPLMMLGGVAGGAATKAVGAGLKALGAESLGTLVASGSPFLAANVGKAVKYSGLLGNRIIGGAVNMGTFMGMNGALQAMASTDSTEDGYWSSVGLAGLEGFEEGAKMGTALGVLGMAGGKLSNLASTAKGRAAIAASAFLAENQIFAASDYLADPEKFNWVDSSLDAFYMMMAGRVSGMMTHGTEGMKRGFANILYGEPKGMPRLTDDEKSIIQKAFGGMDFVKIAGDVNNIGKILADKENIPLNVRQKIAGATMGAFEPNRPHTYMTNIRGNEIHERAKDGELLAIHKFADKDERDRIMQEIADRKSNDEMISYYNLLNLKNQPGLADVLDNFSRDYETNPEAVREVMAKKPVERSFEEQEMINDLSSRLHDAAFPEGELHPVQSEVDGGNLAGSEPVVDPNVSQQLSQEVDKAFDEYSRFLQEHAEVRDGIDSLGEARPDEVLLYIANNYSGSERDEGMRVVSNYFNAMAKKNGYMRKVGDNINNYVDEQVDSSGFKGMLDGEPDVKNIITVTDGEINPETGQPRRLTLLNGDVGTRTTPGIIDEANGINTDGSRVIDAEKSGGQIICRDENGQFVILKPDAKISFVEQVPKEDFANSLREGLGVQNTQTVIETGLEKVPEPQQETQQGAQPAAEAGQEKTGANKTAGAPNVGRYSVNAERIDSATVDDYGKLSPITEAGRKYYSENPDAMRQDISKRAEAATRYLNGELSDKEYLAERGYERQWIDSQAPDALKSFVIEDVDKVREFLSDNGEQKNEPVIPEQPQQPAEAAEAQPAEPAPAGEPAGTEAMEIPTDKDGVKRYEQSGIDVDAAIEDLRKDQIDPTQMADAMISEAEETIKKIGKKKNPKPADIVKDTKARLDAQQVIDYWTKVRDKVAQQRADELARESAEREEQRRKAAEEAALQARQKQEAELSADERFKANRERFSASREEGDEDSIVLANGETIDGHYVLVEADAVTPSHNPRGNFAKSEGFPVDENGKTINDRDYENDKNAQMLVQKRSQSYDQRAVNTPVVVSEDGIVLSGNDRTMSGQLAAEQGTDKAYVDYIKKHAKKWGFTEEQISNKKNPRIVFVPKDKMDYNAETFAKFNQDEKKSQSKLETSVKMGKVLAKKPQTLSQIGTTIDKVENLSDLYSNAELTKEVLLTMKEGGLITDEGIARLTDENGLLSAQGKDEFETMLAGVVVDEDALRTLNNPANSLGDLRKSIAYAVVPLVKNQTLGDYAIIKDVSEAVRLYDRARKAGLVGKDGDITNYFVNKDAFDGAPMDNHSLTQLLLANQMSKGGYHLKRIIEAYNAEGQNAAAGQVDMWSGGVRSKEEIISDILKQQGYDAESIRQRVERLRETQPPVERDTEGREGGTDRADDSEGEGRTEPEGVEPQDNEIWEDANGREHFISVVDLPNGKRGVIATPIMNGKLVGSERRNITQEEYLATRKEVPDLYVNGKRLKPSEIPTGEFTPSEYDKAAKLGGKDYKSYQDEARKKINSLNSLEEIEAFRKEFVDKITGDSAKVILEDNLLIAEERISGKKLYERDDMGFLAKDKKGNPIRLDEAEAKSQPAEKEPSGKAEGTDEYLKPRNEKEKEIVADVEKKLSEDIKAAEEEVRKAKSALEKARAKESDKATDFYSDDEAFKEKGQLFDFEDMPTDRSQEGVNNRTRAERERLNEAQAKLDKLQSEAERNSRVRGALDNERLQTEIPSGEPEGTGTPTKPQPEKQHFIGDVDKAPKGIKWSEKTTDKEYTYKHVQLGVDGNDLYIRQSGTYANNPRGKEIIYKIKDYKSHSINDVLLDIIDQTGVAVPRHVEDALQKFYHDNNIKPDSILRPAFTDPMEAIEKTATEFKKEQDEEIGITHDETPEQKADRENAEKLAATPITADEIDGADISDVEKTLAKAYLNGNQGFLQKAAYLKAYDNVRNRREDGTGDSLDAEGRTQLDSGENKPESRPGRTGEPTVPVDETKGGVTDEGQRRLENGEGQPDTPAGKRGDRSVSGAEPAVDGLPAGSERPTGGSEPSSTRPDVRGAESDKGSGKDTPKPAAGSDAAIAASKQRLAELRQRFKKAGRNGTTSVSLAGMNAEQIEILMDITTEAANLGYQYLVKGAREFKEWNKQMLDDFHDWLREDMKWSDAEIDEYLNEVWNCEYNIDGVTRSIREWASLMGEKELRKVVKADRGSKFEAQKAAESIEVKTGDIDNIRETLPFLLPEQQDDVLKAETQFFDEKHQDREHGNGKGMMFTNGTGTGKTYTGLGIVKRFVKQGKGRVLILTPSQEKVTDWANDGLNLGLNVEKLDDIAKAKGTTATKSKGTGVVVTTYANARQNLALLEDCFDLIVYDESHKITEGKEAAEGEMYKFHQMLTNKDVEKSIDRQTYWLPEWIEYRNLIKEREENRKMLDNLDNYDNEETVKVDGNEINVGELRSRLNARMLEIENRFGELQPIMQEIRESKRGQAEIDSKRTKTVFLSATPFNTRENMKYAEGYLFSYPEEDPNTVGTYNHRRPEDAFLERYFPAGYRWRYGRLESHVSNAEALGRQEIDFSDYLQNQLGTLSGRMISSDYDYSRDFPIMTLDHAGRFNQAMSDVYRNKRYNAMAEAFQKSFDYNYSTALFEAMKTSLVIDRIKEHLKRGQKVVVFHRRRTSGDLEPPFERALNYARLMAEKEGQNGNQKGKQKILDAVKAFSEDFADMLEWEKGLDYTLPRDQIAKVFGEDKVGFFSGAENKKTKHGSVEDFMKDNGGKDIIVIQEASGKEGISLHDQTGEHQRVEINLALPQSPIAFIQIEGRIYRIGQKSNAIFEYPLLGLDLETSLFAQKFNSALGTTENLALGSKARNLRKSIANSILLNTGEVDYDRQGLGGKDMDGQVASRTKDSFDEAISDYYGNQKMQRGRGNREGYDYFPTPEPVGFKMVEWGQLMEGESALEPSAGHGAIARYVPETNALTAIEPSADLFSKLQMRAGGPGRRFEEKTFEDYPLANKHDVIVMNPPYGVQGKMAMEHVAKAFKHLNEGGRLIAIIPDGPSMERRLDAWLNSTGADGTNGANVLVGEVKLPDVAFGRAGTNVRTRIVVIDKVTRAQMREGMPERVSVDLSGAKTVEDMFEQLRHVNMPERTIDQAAIAQKQAMKTRKSFEDNKFVRDIVIDDKAVKVTNRSSYDSVPGLQILFDRVENPSYREALLTQFGRLQDARDNVETLDYGKWKNKVYGSGKNAVPAVDAIRDYCDTAIKTIANVLKTTPDGLEKELKAMKAEAERRRQEEEERYRRMREEKERARQEKVNAIIETAIKENPDNETLTADGIRRNMEIAHGRDYLEAAKAKRNLRNAYIDWETGHKMPNKQKNIEEAYKEEMPLSLETMKRLMAIAETSIDANSKMAAKRALEMSGIDSETGEAKEGFDYSAHDEYYEKDLRGFLAQASHFARLKTKIQESEEGKPSSTVAPKPAGRKEAYEYKLDQNTKTGADMHLVVMNERVDDATYKDLQRKAKALNDGYYNRFKKAWHFKTEEDARKFMEQAGAQNGTRFSEEPAKKTPKTVFSEELEKKKRKEYLIEAGKGYSKEEFGEVRKSSIGKSVDGENADKILHTMKNTAEEMPAEVEFTDENYEKAFGDGVETPIGHVKMSDNQKTKLADNYRTRQIALAKRTLESPDMIIEKPSSAKEGQKTERPSTYVFVKTFRDKDGKLATYYFSVTVQRDGMEVSMSNYIPEEKQVKRDMREGKLAYIKDVTLPSESGTSEQGDQHTLPAGADSSESKYRNNSDAIQENGKEIGKINNSGTKFKEEKRPVFESNAHRAVVGIKQEKATPEQWLKMIEKNGGLKKEEDKWMGLSEWLKGQDKKSLTKQEVLDFIRENQIQIEEVNYNEHIDLDNNSNMRQLREEFDDYVEKFKQEKETVDAEMVAFNDEMYGKYGKGWSGKLSVADKERGEKLQARYNRLTDDPKELAFNEMVERYGDDFGMAFEVNWGNGKLEPQMDMYGDDISDAAKYFLQFEEQPINSTRLSYTTKGLENKKEIALTVPTVESWNEDDSIHFGDAGEGRAVAWARFGETTDKDGKKVLVIDEIQSKRHQEGREKGYDNEWKSVVDEVVRKTGFTKEQVENNPYDVANWMTFRAKTDAGRELAQRLRDTYSKLENLVPDAPFEKNWHELAMKRMLRYAAENGYDKVAWTKGEQQADRYNIGNAIEEIYTDVPKGKGDERRYIAVTGKDREMHTMRVNSDGTLESSSSIFNGQNINDVFGKELANRILSAEGKTRINDDGLRIGGEGMKGFYDQMLPRFMDKYGKKWGVKTGEVELPNVERAGRKMWSVDVTPSMKSSVMEGQTMFKEGTDVSGLPEHAQKLVRSIEKTAKKLNTPVKIARSIDEVTNKDALKALREGRIIKGWFEEGTGEIVLYLPNIADKYSAMKTVAHEVVGHNGLRALLGEEGYRSYMRTLWLDMKDESLSDYIKENYARHGDIYTTIDEYLAEAAEKGYGNLPMWQKVRDVMTDALRKAGLEMTPSISDVKYMVWLSKNQLENKDPMNAIRREALLYRLGKEKYEAKVRNGEFSFDEGATETQQHTQPFFPGNKTLFRSTPSAKVAKLQYERALNRLGYAWKESHIDKMQGAIELMRAISGVKKIEDIPSVENFVLAENQMSSKEEQINYLFNRDYIDPLTKAVGAVLPNFGSKTEEALRNLQIYMVEKSGLERNRCLFVRDKIREYRKDADMDQKAVDKLEEDWNQLLDDIRDDIRKGDINLREYLENMDAFIKQTIDPNYKAGEHDYSGLTAMTGSKKGYDDSSVIDEVMNTESRVGEEGIKNLWEKTKAVSQYGLDMEYEGGLDSKEKHDKVSKMFEWYVPMRGYDETRAEEVYDYLEDNKGSEFVGPVLMNAKGRESQSDVDIFAQLGAMSCNAVHRALRNQMKQAFARFVRNHYDKDGKDRLVTELKYLWGEKRYDQKTGTEYWEEVFPEIPENASADQVAKIVEDFENDMKAKEATGDAKRMRQNSTIPFRPSQKNKSQHIVEVYINGDKKTFIVNGNPRAAQAINGELNPETNHRLINMITRTMAQLNTSYNPDFVVGNTERDWIFASAAILAKESPKYFAQWQKNYFGRGIGRGVVGVPAMHTNLFKRYREGNLNMNNPTDRYFKEFMENGGETGWVEQKNLDKWRKEIVKGVKLQGTAEKAGRFIINAIPEAIEAMNERAENAARFATYMTSRQMGRSITRSVSDAKEVSVNFNRKGAGLKTKDFAKNRNALQRMNAIAAARTAQFGQDYIMFYNAGVQGLNNAAKILRDHPIKASTIFAGFALGAFLMSRLNQSLIDDEDPKERGGIQNPYAELPEWIRRNRLCLYAGKGEFITVDLPIELRALYGIGDIAAAYTTHPELRSQKPVWQDVMTQMTQILPIDFMGEHPGEPWMSVVPSFAMPFAEVAMNQNWYGRKIEKDQYIDENDPRWTRAYKNANKAYIDASKGLNAGTNRYSNEDLKKMGIKDADINKVDPEFKGSADGKITDPAIVEHIVNGYFGGAGQTAGRLADIMKGALQGENFGELAKSPQMPILRRLHYSPTEQNKMARTLNKWWHYKDEMDNVMNDVKVFKEYGVTDPLAKMKQLSLEDSVRATRAALMQDAQKQYKKLKKLHDKMEDGADKDDVQMRMDQLMENTVMGLDSIR